MTEAVRDRSRWGRPSENGPRASKGEDSTSTPTRQKTEPSASRQIGAGWGAWDETRSSGGGFVKDFRPSEEKQIIRFLEDAPWAVFQRHWFEKRPYTCLGDDCALCNLLGDKPRQTAAFNIATAQTDGSWEIQSWATAGRVTKQIKTMADKDLSSPTRYFWVSRSGSNQSTVYAINEIKARDLVDDWGITPLTDDELEEMGASCQTLDDLRLPDPDELEKMVRSKIGSRDY